MEKRKKISDFRISLSAFSSLLTENTELSGIRLALDPRLRIQSAKGGSLGRQWTTQKQNSLSAINHLLI
jgi:hypothetical protein